MLSDSLLPLLPGRIWPGVVAPDRILSRGQIEPFDIQTNDLCKIRLLEIELLNMELCVNKWLSNWIVSDT